MFGERVPRREDGRFLTGRGRYTADFEPKAAHAAFVRSDFAHARILGVDAALAEARHVFEWRFAMERSAAMPLETRGIVARYDAMEDRLLVHDSTQAPTGVRFGLALLFGLDADRVHVVAPDVGGGFGMKVIQFYPEEVLIPWAARRLGVPVKWVEDRRENFIGSNHERGPVHHVR